MKAFRITVRTITAVHRWTAIAVSSADAAGAALIQFHGQPVAVAVRPEVQI